MSIRLLLILGLTSFLFGCKMLLLLSKTLAANKTRVMLPIAMLRPMVQRILQHLNLVSLMILRVHYLFALFTLNMIVVKFVQNTVLSLRIILSILAKM